MKGEGKRNKQLLTSTAIENESGISYKEMSWHLYEKKKKEGTYKKKNNKTKNAAQKTKSSLQRISVYKEIKRNICTNTKTTPHKRSTGKI